MEIPRGSLPDPGVALQALKRGAYCGFPNAKEASRSPAPSADAARTDFLNFEF
ncbi:hypothetical protein [Nostoc sp.]|uniref:hypothetical protein n=1 Tax=Nostoc sp. TaxID=1180 RepID=UPI002FF4FCFE